MSGPEARCPFCRLVAGDEVAHVVAATDDGFAFLDRSPLFVGHTLVVPPTHHETLLDLPSVSVEPLFSLVRKVAAGVQAATDSPGSFVAMNNVVSQSVPHLHVHVVPRRPKDGLRGFFWPRTRYDDDEHMARTAEAIRRSIDAAEDPTASEG